MKWTVNNSISKKVTCIPNNSITRRRANLLISSLLRYTLTKRKHESEAQQGEKRILSDNRFNCIRKIEGHQPNEITRKTSDILRAIQLSDGDGDRSLHIAVANENFKLVEKLCLLMVKNCLSLDIRNYSRQTPLHIAVMVGNVDILKLLLNFGASLLIYDRNGNSILHLAVKSDSNEVLDALLSHPHVKTILNSMDYEGYSPLHYAVFKNNSNAIRMLQTSGADMNKIDGKSGRTALIHAVLEQNTNMVDLLLSCGACPLKMDYSGQSAFDMALQTTNLQIITMLDKFMHQKEEGKVKELPKYCQINRNY